MAFPVFTHQLTVTASEVTPRGPLSCGTDGDKCATRLNFYFEAPDPNSIYRLEIVRGDGVYDITEPLSLSTDGPELNFDIPAVWTAAGTAVLRLVECVVADGDETHRRYYPPILLAFACRDEGVPMGDAPLRWQELLTRAEKVMNEAAAATGVAVNVSAEAQESVRRLQGETESALQTIRNASYVAGEIAATCADMRDAAQVFADEAASAARRAEEAAGTVGEHTHDASAIPYDGSEQYIGGSTVEEALNNVSNYIVGFNSHVHHDFDVSCGSYGRDISHVGQALECIFGELDIFSTALDELHAYAQGLVNGGGAE